MNGAIFLSASVPDARRAPEYARTADAVAISAAVTALVHVTLGRRPLVWGGHPAITPMIQVLAEGYDVNYGEWVRLYQSRHFKDEFPEDNERFSNVTYTDDIDRDQARSLRAMRERMFTDYQYGAAVFIGGMGGIVDEFDLLRELQPDTDFLPVVSTGGATLDVAERLGNMASDLREQLDYVRLFHTRLGIPVTERRYSSPYEQPEDAAARRWQATDT